MRRAMPKPCSGPSACSVFKIIRSSVPCSTSDFFDFMVRSVLLFALASFPRRDPARDWRPQFPSFGLSKGAYHLSFAMSIGRRRATVVSSLGYHSLLEDVKNLVRGMDFSAARIKAAFYVQCAALPGSSMGTQARYAASSQLYSNRKVL